MSEMALERSVLERKERDELVTIAGALGLKPGARAKKETVIDQILKGAGVGGPKKTAKSAASDDAEPAAKPKRGRAKATTADNTAPNSAASRADSVATRDGDSGDHNDNGIASRAPRADSAEGAEPSDGAARGPRSRGPRPRRGGSATLFDPFAEATDLSSSSAPDDLDDIVVVRTPAGLDGAEAKSDRGDRQQGDRQQGDRQDRQQGDRAERQQGDRLQGDRPQGDRPDRGDRFDRNRDRNRNRGDRPQGDRPPFEPRGDRPQGDRGPKPFGNQGNQGGQGGSWDADGPGGKRNRRRRNKERALVSPAHDAQAERISETYDGELIDIAGILDLADQGYGYIRAKGYLPTPGDVYVPVNKVRQFGLRRGDMVVGAHRPATAQEKFPAIVNITTVNGHTPEVAALRPKFEDLTPLFPDVKLKLEQPGHPGNMVNRIVDLVSPIGKGQRGLIVSPPKAGKTTVMKQIATAIEANNPEVHLMVLLVDERPEEVTDMRRTVKGEVIASTFDKPADEHTMVSELCIERAKRLVEEGRDVVIILDGITRLARAYNLAAPATGRIMSGGIDTGALYPPKKFFGSARNIEEGGSLTILATALIETGSAMDTVIFEEFKGTGNMELRLDRRLAEKRIYPAINVNESSTRHEELLFDRKELEVVYRLRRVLNGLAEDGGAAKGLELLMDRMKVTRNNVEFLAELAKAPTPAS
jgi:transcription termination factor Rho